MEGSLDMSGFTSKSQEKRINMQRDKRYFLAYHTDNEWEYTDKRGYGDKLFAQFNAIEISKRDGGKEVGLLRGGDLIEIYFGGKIKEVVNEKAK